MNCVARNMRDRPQMPAPEDGRWVYVNFLTSTLKAQVGYSFDLYTAAREVAKRRYVLHQVPRLLRAS